MPSSHYQTFEDKVDDFITTLDTLTTIELSHNTDCITQRHIWWIHQLREQLHDYREGERANIFKHDDTENAAIPIKNLNINVESHDLTSECRQFRAELRIFTKDVRNDTDAEPHRIISRQWWVSLLEKSLARFRRGEQYGVFQDSNRTPPTRQPPTPSPKTKRKPSSRNSAARKHSTPQARHITEHHAEPKAPHTKPHSMSKAARIEAELAKLSYAPKQIEFPIYDPEHPPTLTPTTCPADDSLGEPTKNHMAGREFAINTFAFARYCPVEENDTVDKMWHDVHIVAKINKGTSDQPDLWYIVTDALAGRKAINDNREKPQSETAFHYWEVPGLTVSNSLQRCDTTSQLISILILLTPPLLTSSYIFLYTGHVTTRHRPRSHNVQLPSSQVQMVMQAMLRKAQRQQQKALSLSMYLRLRRSTKHHQPSP